MHVMRIGKLVSVVVLLAFASACSPEVGSKDWCEAVKEKPKGDWTATEASEFAKSCIF
jgi:hypothetical protein